MLFSWLAELCDLPIDLINFLISQCLALLLASFFRSVLHPSKVSAGIRHVICLVLGLFFGYFCFGQQAIHIAGLPAVCYIVIRTQNPQIVQRLVMIVALTYLSCIHLHRQYYYYESYSLDISGPLMIITQKVTSLAFSIHDGFTREQKELTKSQQYHAVQKLPSALEFFSYALHFQGILAGPLVFYRDYVEFIEGYHILKHAPDAPSAMNKSKWSKEIVQEPSPMKSVINKVAASIVCAYIFMKFNTMYSIDTIKEDEFINNTSMAYKFWFAMMATTTSRFKFYHAWIFADAIYNNAGMGFNGYEADGKSKWDLITNINVIGFEFGTNFRDCINSWNLGTNRWLRMIVYERVPKRYGTVLTFALSALWHGFYPGYYITFASGALFVMAARSARRLFRHRFQKSTFVRRFYDILTCFVTRFYMGYATFPFVILGFKASLTLYLKFYMCLHVIALVTIFVLPRFMRGERTARKAVAVAEESPAVKQVTKQAEAMEERNDPLPEMDSDALASVIKKNLEMEARNLEEFLEKKAKGIVELKEDLWQELLSPESELRRRYPDGVTPEGGVDAFIKKEINALNQAVQQATVLPAVLSNGHAK
ncbi:lysophospholipid acyltransferase 6 [Phlebotomus argentipes]|uniref:lysophospholipid acyltransferase 6 n=1 Tax=Phlebotomus argentipes TaxID=94469 RepID=UPI002892A17E|nr:lysophospholipid acyltransferase 6 [Phlebotomus argentipes]